MKHCDRGLIGNTLRDEIVSHLVGITHGGAETRDLAKFEQHRKTKGAFPKYCGFKREGLGPPKSRMSLTAPGIKGMVTDFMDATPSATVAFQAVSAPVPDIIIIIIIINLFKVGLHIHTI